MDSYFRTLEVSDPRFEFDGLRFITVKSRALQNRADLTLFVPETTRSARSLPLVILLHGVYGSHWAWALKGGAHRTARRLMDSGLIPPMVLAMPSDGLWGDGSGYLPRPEGNFEQWIADEIPRVLAESTEMVDSASPRFICGLSMGGFGALRLGAKFGPLFQGISAHSSITHLEQMRTFAEESWDLASYVEEDISIIRTMLKHRGNLPSLRFDCGVDDPLIEPNRALHRDMEQSGIPHQYKEFPGAHNWLYWENHLEDSLRFFATILGEKHSQ